MRKRSSSGPPASTSTGDGRRLRAGALLAAALTLPAVHGPVGDPQRVPRDAVVRQCRDADARLGDDGGAVEPERAGIERTFDQDPTMALRVFADIALRALSPAVNDPSTPIQALDEIDSLLRQIVTRDLAVDTINGSDDQPRLRLRLPTWDGYLTVALDELIASASSSWPVRRRVDRLLADLLAIAPTERVEALQARIERAQSQDRR